MAGTASDDEENPVVVNVVPLIDILFCICIFFFCTFHFKELEGKIESWLPKDKGFGRGCRIIEMEEVRVMLKWDEVNKATTRQMGSTYYPDDIQLYNAILVSYEDLKRTGEKDASVIIDAGEPEGRKVPWQDVITVMDLCKNGNINKIEFAAPVGYEMQK